MKKYISSLQTIRTEIRKDQKELLSSNKLPTQIANEIKRSNYS